MKNTKTLIFIVGLLLIFSTGLRSYAQVSYIPIESSTEEVGQIYGKPIQATVYEFPQWVYKSHLDTNRNGLVLVLRKAGKKKFKNKGYISFFDLSTNQLKWAKSTIAFNQDFHKDYISYTSHNEFFVRNIDNGNINWSLNGVSPFVIDEDMDLILSSDTRAIEFSTGKTLWKRPVPSTYGWNDYTLLDDSTLIIAASGLHTFNLKTGVGWDVSAITGKKDYSSTAAANAVGLGLGLLTGTYMMSTGYDVVHQLASNILIDSNYIYFSSRDYLMCLDMHGKSIWKTALIEKLVSNSSIFYYKDQLVMVNYGIARLGYRYINYGESYLGFYNRKSGKEKYKILKSKDEQINEFQLDENTITLLYNTKISKINLDNGEIIIQKDFSLPKEKQFSSFSAAKRFYLIAEDSSSFTKVCSNDDNFFVISEDNMLYEFDSLLNCVDTIEGKDIYLHYYNFSDYKIIKKGTKNYIVKENNEITGELNVEANLKGVWDEKLFYTLKNQLIIANLEGLN